MTRRRTSLVTLVIAVTALHLGLLPAIWPTRLGDGAAAEGRRERIQVSFVQTLQPAEPPVRQLRAPRPVRAAARALAAAAEVAASAPELAPAAAMPPLAELPAPALAESIPVPPAPVVADAADATTFDWPPSTRLSYRVTGDVQGPVEGDARVEWLRQGLRYQVHLEMSVALLATRRVSSEGIITPAGLSPRRFDEETRLLLREPRHVAIDFGDEQVRMADGRLLPRPEGVQDSASQFVQMTWLFNARPELQQPGQSVSFPLALPRRIDPWIYDVVSLEPVETPAGVLQAVHVRPRREARGGDLTVEFWVAPSLQFLPVRLRIRQGRAVTLELLLDRLPEQVAPGR